MEMKVFLFTADAGGRVSDAALASLLRRALGFECALTRSPGGKPLLADARFGVSVSHSAGRAAVAAGGGCVGVDIQERRPIAYQRMADRFFTAAEAALVRRLGSAAFYDIWAAREAYCKYTGEGLGGFGSFAVADGGGLFAAVNGHRLVWLPAGDGFSLCVCCDAETVTLEEVEL